MISQRATSIEDIARAAGVSHSTVSRALRDSPSISIATRSRIQLLAREMGYSPNALARSLRGRRTHTIGLVVPNVGDPFFGDVVKGVEDVARPAGNSVFLSASHNDPEQELDALQVLHGRRVDGLLVADARSSRRYAERLGRHAAPVVLINGQEDRHAEGLHAVQVDDRAGARLAVEHLLQLGHRAIGYLGAGARPRSNAERHAGYRDALAVAGVAAHPEWAITLPHVDHEDDVGAGQAALAPLLDHGVTAVFCYNDMIAVGVLLACRERRIEVPRDLSVVGFDDVDVARYVTPTLTTIRQPRAEIGQAGMRLLLTLLDGQAVEDQCVVPTLVPRMSTAAPRRRGGRKG